MAGCLFFLVVWLGWKTGGVLWIVEHFLGKVPGLCGGGWGRGAWMGGVESVNLVSSRCY